MILPAIIALIASLALALVGVPLAGKLAIKVNLVDKPDNTRKLHRKAIPLIGGIVVLLVTFAVSAGVILGFDMRLGAADATELFALLIASIVIVAVGVADDSVNLRGRQKLFGQIVAATVLIVGGYQFNKIQFDGLLAIDFGIFSIVIVYLWCLVAINSINLLDGADGFASTVGIIISLSLAAMALYMGYYVDAVILLALAGSLLGFLRFNFPPAKAYLGDAGSMLIGLVIAAIAIRCTFKQAVAYAFFAPVALLAIPLIDTTAAVVRRRFTGRSIYAEDRGHLHHVMARNGLSPRACLVWVAALCSMSSMGAALSIITNQSEYAIASIVMVLAVMIFGNVFAVAEFNLVIRKIKSMIKSIVGARGKSHADRATHGSVQLQGHYDWEEMWCRLKEFATESELNQIMLDVNAPWLHEGFHAEWIRKGVKGGTSNQWRVEVPMVVEGRVFARIVIQAPRDGRFTHHEVVVNLMKITADLEQELAGMTSSSSSAIKNLPDLPEEEALVDSHQNHPAHS